MFLRALAKAFFSLLVFVRQAIGFIDPFKFQDLISISFHCAICMCGLIAIRLIDRFCTIVLTIDLENDDCCKKPNNSDA